MLLRLLRRWLDVPEAPFRIALLALILGLPSLAIGLQADDFLLATLVAKDPLGAFAFVPDAGTRDALAATGDVAWTASPRLMQSFFRPLASLSHWVDFTLTPIPAWMHLENVLLYAALVLLAAQVFRRLIGDRLVAGLAGLLYAVNGTQSVTVGWISGRNTLLAALFGLAAFALHERARCSPTPRRHVLAGASLVVFVVALLCAEGGLSALALMVAYGLFLDRAGWRLGLVSALPALVIGAGHLALRGALGHGAHGMGLYVQVGDPVALLWSAAQGVPTYLASQLTVCFASLTAFRPNGPAKFAVISLFACAALVPFFLPLLHRNAHARFFLASAVMSAVVLAGTVPQDRLVFFVGFGTTGLLGIRLLEEDVRRWARALSSCLLHVHVGLAALGFIPLSLTSASTSLGGGARALDRAMPERADAAVVIVHAPNDIVTSWARSARAIDGRVAPRWARILYGGQGAATARQIDAHTLEMTVERGWLATPMERAQSDRTDFLAGESIAVPGMRAEVRAITSSGTPRTVRFVFDQPFTELTLLTFEAGAFVPWSPPPRGVVSELSPISPF